MAADSNARLERLCHISTFVVVPALLAALTAMQGLHSPETAFLVLPPFAVVIYIIFRNPLGKSANLRSIVLLPCLGAAVGELCFRFLGMTPAGVALDTLAVLSLQAAIRAHMPPALALSVLAMLLHVTSFTYVLGVAEQSALIAIVFFLWQRFVIVRLREAPLTAARSAAVSMPEPQ